MDVDFLLIRKMRQGDDDAFDTFVRKYYDDSKRKTDRRLERLF